MNLDGPGYALTLLLVGQIIILAMAFGSGLGTDAGRTFKKVKVRHLFIYIALPKKGYFIAFW